MIEIVIIVLLIILNGIFAMAEVSIIASRKARLQQQAEKGSASAKTALELAESPARFLSTVQIGITLIGILAGAFGGATVAAQIAVQIAQVPLLAPYADAISFGIVVAFTTYLSLIIGELVPKQLALHNPEQIAQLVAVPMHTLSKIASPFVTLLTFSTTLVLKLLGQNESDEPPVTQEEIQTMVLQGVEAGVFVESEHELVRNVFRLSDRRANTIMTPHTEMVWLNVEDDDETIMNTIRENPHSRFVVAEGDLDHVIGVVIAKDLLLRALAGKAFDLRASITEPLYVPESMFASRMLELFREKRVEMAIVIGEHGEMQGLITLQDLLDEIVGEIVDEPQVVQRDANSWLLDGMLNIYDLKEALSLEDELPGEENYQTLGGFVMAQLERIPAVTDTFEWDDYLFEVVDMDGNRVDKVMVTTIHPVEEAPTDAPSA